MSGSPNRETRRAREKIKKIKKPRGGHLKGGHPAKRAARLRKDGPPDELELELRRITRIVRKEATANESEGLAVGILAAYAEYVSEIICEHHEALSRPDDPFGVKNFLINEIGRQTDTATLPDFVDRYRTWREECRKSAQEKLKGGE